MKFASRSITFEFKDAEINGAFTERLNDLNKIAELLITSSTKELLDIKMEYESFPSVLSLVDQELKKRGITEK